MQAAYAFTLRQTLRFHPVAMLISVALVGGTVYLFGKVPTGFLPSEDTGQIMGQTEGLQGVGFEAMLAHQLEAAKVVAADPNVEGLAHVVQGGNQGRMFIDLKPREERTLNADQIIEELRPKLAQVPGFRVYLQNPPVIRVGARNSRSLYQYTLQNPDTAELYAGGAAFRGPAQADSRPDGCDERPADQEPAGERDVRPRPHRVLRPVDGPGAGRAVERLRHAPGVDDLRAHEPVRA